MRTEIDLETGEVIQEDIEIIEDQVAEEMVEDSVVEEMIEEGLEVEMDIEAIVKRDGMKEVEETTENPGEMDLIEEDLNQEKEETIGRYLRTWKIINITDEEEVDQMEDLSILRN